MTIDEALLFRYNANRAAGGKEESHRKETGGKER